MKLTNHKGDPRTVIHVSLMLIFTTNFVCSHREGVLNDCVRLDVSQRRLAWRVGVGGNEFFVLSVGGGVRDRGRGCAGMFSCLLPFLGFETFWRKRSASGSLRAAG